MPRVVKEVPRKEKQIVCHSCGRTIAYVQNDVQEVHGTDISGGPDGQEYIFCPGDGCGKKIIISSW